MFWTKLSYRIPHSFHYHPALTKKSIIPLHNSINTIDTSSKPEMIQLTEHSSSHQLMIKKTKRSSGNILKTFYPTPTIEDYLGIIYTLSQDGEEIFGARLAELLEVTPPTVTVTLKRMVRDGWITLDPKKKVSLTRKGIDASKTVIRRHMLTEWMLSRILNIPWSQIHEEADKIEHAISDEVEQQLLRTLDDPSSCPHGNPMPDMESISNFWKPITEFNENDHLIIRRIHEFLEQNNELLILLEESEIIPGKEITITQLLPLNKTITLKSNQGSVIFGFDIAKNIFAEKL